MNLFFYILYKAAIIRDYYLFRAGVTLKFRLGSY